MKRGRIIFILITLIILSFASEALSAERWALLVGIGNYQSDYVNELKFTSKDAQGIRDILIQKGSFGEDHIRLLTDDQATKQNIVAGLNWLADKSKPDDLVIIFHAGHGYYCEDKDGDEKSRDPSGKDIYDEMLVTYDTDVLKPETGLIDDEFSNLIKRIKSQNLIILFDTCHSGGAALSATMARADRDPDLPPEEEMGTEADLDRQGSFLLTASRPSEYSWASTKLAHGVFTYHLLKALNGEADENGDGEIAIQEARDYINANVPQYYVNEKGMTSQHPTNKDLLGGRHPVITWTTEKPPDDSGPLPTGKLKIDVVSNKGDRATYRQGDELWFIVEVNRDCFVTLFDLSSSGEVTVILPNRYLSNNFLHKGKYRIPGSKSNVEFEISGVPGEEEVIAVATSENVRLTENPLSTYEGYDQGFSIVSRDRQGYINKLNNKLKSLSCEWNKDSTSFHISK